MRIAKYLLIPALLIAAVWLWRRLGDDATVDVAPAQQPTELELLLNR